MKKWSKANHPTTRYSLLLFLVTLSLFVQAQVKGTVSDVDGTPLPFASVYVQGTTNGTTTNPEGDYELILEKGVYQIVFQYIGYGQQIHTVTYAGTPMDLDVVLEAETVSLKEIEVLASSEDPAYQVIRNAIAKRKYYKEQVASYSCDVYIKGNVKILDAPEKILGQEIGDMEGSLDSNRQGIVYLSESISRLYFTQPDQYKEVMTSSKVSGNDNGFSFNSAQDMKIDLYSNHVAYERNVLSPIADGALSYYRYRMEGVLVDEEKHLIYKIEVIPKREEDPVYWGMLYIVDGLWNIQSTDLYLTGKSAQMPFFDTMHIKQTHVPVQDPDVWRLFSQTFTITGGAFGFRFGGTFTGIYTGYDLNFSTKEKQFFDNEVMKVEADANQKAKMFWEEVRPVPLTIEEMTDYEKKDSIRQVRESKPYMDSLDRENNAFKFWDLFLGYGWENSWKKRSFEIHSPVSTIQYNTVQGGNIQFGLKYGRAFDKEGNRRLEMEGRLNYGFSDDVFRASGKLEYAYNPKKFSRFRVSGGHAVTQFNEAEPISMILNTSYSLFSKKNYARLYDKKFLQLDHRHEVVNGLMVYGLLQYANRSPLENRSDYSWFNRDREYAPNIPENAFIVEGGLGSSRALTAGVSLRIRPGQKYFDYPDRKYILGSDFPDIWIHYRKGIPVNPGSTQGVRSDVDFDRLSFVLEKKRIKIGLAGYSSFRLETGRFWNENRVFFQDYRHFLGNEIGFGNSELYLQGFKRLPYYAYSTRKAWFSAHFEHNFQGLITGKLPLLKKLGWPFVAGGNYLRTAESNGYAEVSLGLDKIGFGVLRIFRFDVVASFEQGVYQGVGYLFGMAFPVDEFQF